MARTIEQQIGYKRYDQEILQDIELLQKITEYDFDLKNEDFCEYLRSRRGWSLQPVGMTRDEYKSLLTSWDEMSLYGLLESHPYWSKVSDKEKEEHIKTDIKMLKIFRGAIQDCWEIYNEYEVF